jgi:hypothetical protein
MARFEFNPRNIVMHTGDRPVPAQRTLTAPDAADADDAGDADDAAHGPGWFDSSWDLVRGLEVREGPPVLDE